MLNIEVHILKHHYSKSGSSLCYNAMTKMFIVNIFMRVFVFNYHVLNNHCVSLLGKGLMEPASGESKILFNFGVLRP